MSNFLGADVAIWLERMDKKLALEKDEKGLTCLQLLSKMPHVFRSHTRMGLVKSIIYLCTFPISFFLTFITIDNNATYL